MRKIILSTVATCILLSAAAQDSAYNHVQHLSTNPPSQLKPVKDSRDYFLDKSKKTKTAGIILLSGGLVIGGLGLYIYERTLQEEYSLDHLDDAILSSASGYVAIVAGSAMVITSIPLLVQSGRYKKRAMNLSAGLLMENYRSISQASMTIKRYPAIGLVIHL